MRVKKELNTHHVSRIKGETSRELADRCPDRLVVFPSSPCTNVGCKYAIKEPGYMNCTFVAAEAGEHTLEAIGDMMGITREGVRLIERRALIKIRAQLSQDKLDETDRTTQRQPCFASGGDNVYPISEVNKLSHPGDIIPALNDRELGECGG